MEGRHTQDRYPNRNDLLEEGHTQTDLNSYDSFLDDLSPDSYLLLNDSFAWLTRFLWLTSLPCDSFCFLWLIHFVHDSSAYLMAYWSITYTYSFTYITRLTHVFKEHTSDSWNLRSVLVIILAYCLVPIQLQTPLFTPSPPKSLRVVILSDILLKPPF